MSGTSGTAVTASQGKQVRRAAVLRTLRLIAVVVVMAMITVIGIALAMRIGPPSRQQLMKDARLSDKSVLLVGVKDDVPGIALRDTAGRYTGFDIDIAYMVAADLGFRPDEVRFLPIEPEDRPKMQARDDNEFVTVDLVISTFSITKEREDLDLVSFSAPYLRTEQSVVTRKGHANVQTLEDLAGEKVCTLGTSTSQSEAAKAGAQLSGKNRLSECIDGLLRGAYAAVTTDAAMLAGFVAKYPNKLQHHDIGLAKEEAWGINTGGVEALRTLVNLSLYNSFHNPDDRRWEDAFNRHLREIQPVSLPQQVAVDEQPEVAEVKVRQWPWDTRKYLPPAEPGKRRR